MSKTKLAVIYYSTYGTNHQIALEAVKTAEDAGAEVRLLRAAETAPKAVVDGQDAWKAQAERTADVAEATPDDMEWADAYFFSAPTRYGVVASQMRAFIDTLGGVWQKGALAGKAITATTSAGNAHGGQETTLISLYTSFMHWGSIIVAPGYTDAAFAAAGGNPYGYSAKGGEFDDAGRAAVAQQVKRLLSIAGKLVA